VVQREDRLDLVRVVRVLLVRQAGPREDDPDPPLRLQQYLVVVEGVAHGLVVVVLLHHHLAAVLLAVLEGQALLLLVVERVLPA